ncbi:MAG: nucleoside hydrolase [Phycisphaeraceae bacterium]
MAATIPILLDTDIGSDIDDAVALAYLLKQPACELLGITTVSGVVDQRAALAAAVCDAAGRADVPIHCGAPGPLLTGTGQPDVPQYQAIADRPGSQGPGRGRGQRDFTPGQAVEFLRTTIRSRPNEITLFAIGPMTNIALLFAADPAIPSLIKQLVLMCGVFTAHGQRGPGAREWNAKCDPIATAMTYRARPPVFTSIGLDVTLQCQLPADECRQRFTKAGGPLGIVAQMAEVWFKHRPVITFHDPLAAAIIFQPDLCQYADGQVEVETLSPTLGGLTSFRHDAAEHPHRIATTVDNARFFDHYFAVVGE